MAKIDPTYFTCPYTDHICGLHGLCVKCKNPYHVEAIYVDTDDLRITIPIKDIRHATSHSFGLLHLSRIIITVLLSRLYFDLNTTFDLMKENNLSLKEGDNDVPSISP